MTTRCPYSAIRSSENCSGQISIRQECIAVFVEWVPSCGYCHGRALSYVVRRATRVIEMFACATSGTAGAETVMKSPGTKVTSVENVTVIVDELKLMLPMAAPFLLIVYEHGDAVGVP